MTAAQPPTEIKFHLCKKTILLVWRNSDVLGAQSWLWEWGYEVPVHRQSSTQLVPESVMYSTTLKPNSNEDLLLHYMRIKG